MTHCSNLIELQKEKGYDLNKYKLDNMYIDCYNVDKWVLLRHMTDLVHHINKTIIEEAEKGYISVTFSLPNFYKKEIEGANFYWSQYIRHHFMLKGYRVITTGGAYQEDIEEGSYLIISWATPIKYEIDTNTTEEVKNEDS